MTARSQLKRSLLLAMDYKVVNLPFFAFRSVCLFVCLCVVSVCASACCVCVCVFVVVYCPLLVVAALVLPHPVVQAKRDVGR